MELTEYIDFVNVKIKDAVDKGDSSETIRLMRVLGEALLDKIKELEGGEKP